MYFVQTGAYTRSDDAEQQRARLALMGMAAKITEREQAGRTVYRVRVGPYPARGEGVDGRCAAHVDLVNDGFATDIPHQLQCLFRVMWV